MVSVAEWAKALFPQNPEEGKHSKHGVGGGVAFGECLPGAACPPTHSDSGSSQCDLGKERVWGPTQTEGPSQGKRTNI